MLDKKTVINTLKTIIDPEINLNVIDGKMILDLHVSDNTIKLKFRPTSPTCPIALKLVSDIKDTLLKLGNIKIYIETVDHIAQDKINDIINSY